MRLVARSRQRSAALRQYETCRHTLADELGVEPHEETTALYERIRTAGAARLHNVPISK
jgi:DNA-binding SARP family transcriptional activator